MIVLSTGDGFPLLLLLLLLLLSLALADLVGCVVSASEVELLLADVANDVTIDELLRDAVDPFICDVDDADSSSATAAELTPGDVISRSSDVNARVMLTGDVMIVDDARLLSPLLLLLLLLALTPLVSATDLVDLVTVTSLPGASLLDC